MWFCSVSAAGFFYHFLKFDPDVRRLCCAEREGKWPSTRRDGPLEACNQATGQLWGPQGVLEANSKGTACLPDLSRPRRLIHSFSGRHQKGTFLKPFILQTGAASGGEQKSWLFSCQVKISIDNLTQCESLCKASDSRHDDELIGIQFCGSTLQFRFFSFSSICMDADNWIRWNSPGVECNVLCLQLVLCRWLFSFISCVSLTFIRKIKASSQSKICVKNVFTTVLLTSFFTCLPLGLVVLFFFYDYLKNVFRSPSMSKQSDCHLQANCTCDPGRHVNKCVNLEKALQ